MDIDPSLQFLLSTCLCTDILITDNMQSLHAACRFCVSRKGGTGGGGLGHPQGDMHMVATRLGCQSAMVVTRWANYCYVISWRNPF